MSCKIHCNSKEERLYYEENYRSKHFIYQCIFIHVNSYFLYTAIYKFVQLC